ncbi:MAG: hypothetical protein ABIF85_06470 [Nanoarchaeota archaeon]|nr:hypothetical protein [Nanoarchaeota archaeon]MBU4451987.1 hypothetical protein [Nanoarchaeota archaeon]MCG2724147.1 hypothetical protein [archaeon]
MKGIVGNVINGIGALLIVVVILVFALSTTANVFADKRGETELAIMGLRNTIVQISVAENGIAIYKLPNDENYTVEIDEDSIQVQYSGDAITIEALTPKLKMSHYTAELKQIITPIEARAFCVIKKKDPADSCRPFVEVCVQGTACCNAVFQESFC